MCSTRRLSECRLSFEKKQHGAEVIQRKEGREGERRRARDKKKKKMVKEGVRRGKKSRITDGGEEN